MGVSKQQLLNTVRQLKEYIDYTSGSSNLSNYLSKTNMTEYTPTEDYHPTTKKYVDDVAETVKPKISTEEGNSIQEKKDGLYVSAPTELYGKSAYDLAVANGFKGTEAEWLASLKGQDGTNGQDGIIGADGKSAYEIALANGYEGTETEWLASLKGADGTNGKDGTNGVDGATGPAGADGKNGTDGITPHIGANGNWFIGDTDTGVSAEGGTGSIDISAKDDNALTKEADGLYVPSVAETNISEEKDNAIVKKEDGLYVPSVSKVEINPADNNAIQQTENGIFVEDQTKTIDTLKTRLGSYALYQKYVNIELDSCFMQLAEAYTPVEGEYVPFVKITGSLEINEGRVIIKPSQRIQINVSCNYFDTTGAYTNIRYQIKDYTNDIPIISLQPNSSDNNVEYDFSGFCQYENNTESNCEIGLYVEKIGTLDTLTGDTTMTIQEIGRQTVIDPVEYVDENSGIEDTPVGHILTHMGKTAPKHYLICDGTEYNIADYPYLAQHMIDEFGKVNYFGGDGTTTFAVPDLRGEFLRGSGTAIRDTGSGGEVGEHQNGTKHLYLAKSATNYLYSDGDANVYGGPSGSDTVIQGTNKTAVALSTKQTSTWDGSGKSYYTSRPTNTSVLYCIKYEPTYYFINIPTEQINEEIALLKQQNELLTAQNTLMQEQIDQLSEIIASINREV